MSAGPGPVLLGILNLTTDSFSDGGSFSTTIANSGHSTASNLCDIDRALVRARAKELVAQGAWGVDVGGESTRPGAVRVSEQLELARVVPVVSDLVSDGIRVSVDTMRASVARAAVAAGASIINDVSGGAADPAMGQTMAWAAKEHGADICLMHWKTTRFGDAAGCAHDPATVLAEVKTALLDRARWAEQLGIPSARLILDPGLGFAKSDADNWALLRGLPELNALGYRLLIGGSRKRFLQHTSEVPLVNPAQADPATAALTTVCTQAGVWGVRIHDVGGSAQARAVALAVQE